MAMPVPRSCLLVLAWLAPAAAFGDPPARAAVRPQAAPMRWIPRPSSLAVERGEVSPPRAKAPAETARDSLERAFRREQSRLRRYPSKPGPHLRLGEIYYRIGNDYAARHHLDRFLESGPAGADSLRAARLRARCLVRLDRAFEAAVALDQLARVPAAPAAVDHDRALLLRSDRLEAEAVMAEMRAVERSAGESEFLREAVAQWKELERADQALAAAAALCRDPRSSGEDQFQAGYLAHCLGRREESARRYEAALARDPDHAEAHFNLALLRQEMGDPAGAIAHWREVVRLRPAYDPTYFHLGTILLELERPAEATEVFLEYLRHGTDFPALVEAASILHALGTPADRWRGLLDARTEALAADGRRRREEWERAAAARDSTRAAADPSPGAPAEGGPEPVAPAPADSEESGPGGGDSPAPSAPGF